MSVSENSIQITQHEGAGLGAALAILLDLERGKSVDLSDLPSAEAALASLALRSSTGDHALDLDLFSIAHEVTEGTEEET